MKQLLLTLLFVLNTAFADTFSIIIDKPFNSSLTDITQDYDRSITAVGFSHQFNTNQNYSNSYTDPFEYLSSVSDNDAEAMHLIKTSLNGSIKLDKTISLKKCAKAISVTKTPSNGYFVGGYTQDGKIVVIKLDQDANILFNKLFGTNNYNELNTLTSLKDGGVLVVATSKTSRSPNDNIFQSGIGLNDIYLTRFSKDGQKLWSKKFGTIHDDIAVDAIEANDGSIIVLGKTSYEQNQNVTIMKITQNGNQIWLKEYKTTEIIKPFKIIALRDGNFLISISQQTGIQKERIRLLKIDTQSNVINDKTITTTYSSALKDIAEYSNSNIIGVGYVRDSYNTDGLVMILNSKLEMLHQEHYGDENLDELNAVTILHNSKAAAAGIRTDENSQESNMWITLINLDATITQKSKSSKKIEEKLSEIFEDEKNKKQVEIKKDLKIDLSDDNLYFRVGQSTLTQQQKDFLENFYKKFIPFIKENQDKISSIEINGHTSSEWGDADFTDRYLNNANLSMKRAFSVTEHLIKSQDEQTQKLLSKVLKGVANSYSKNLIKDGVEDKDMSRRVSFKVNLEK